MAKTIKLWVRVSGTIDVTEEQMQRMISEDKDWLPEFDTLTFERDHADDYVPECSFEEYKREQENA